MPKGGKTFLGLTVLFALVCLTFIVRIKKGDIHLAMDQWHEGSSDFVFRYLTHLGDGLAFVVVVLALAIMRKSLRMTVSFAAAGVAVLLIIAFLKGVFFAGVARPWGYFEEGMLRIIPDLEQHTSRSFPSGHTTAAFALYGLLAFWINKRGWSVALFVLAVAVGYSRMFLNQHFLVDVFAGSILGALIAWGIHALFFIRIKNQRWNRPIF